MHLSLGLTSYLGLPASTYIWTSPRSMGTLLTRSDSPFLFLPSHSEIHSYFSQGLCFLSGAPSF